MRDARGRDVLGTLRHQHGRPGDDPGATVVGSWKDLPNHKTGRVEGTVRGCLLMFSWTQTDDMIPNMPRETSGHGVLQYIVDPPVGTGRPIHRFEGSWGYDQDVQGGGMWTGRKKREGA
jgi:hypothetical protein